MKDTIRKAKSLDDFAVLTEPMPKDAPRYDFGKKREYCRKIGKGLADMSQKEIDQFMISTK